MIAQVDMKPVSVSQLQDECPLCQGAGFVHPVNDGVVFYTTMEPCACQVADIAKRKADALIAKCQLPPDCAGLTFEQFEKVEGAEEAYDSALMVAGGKLEWLIMMGEWDRGKSHLAVSICRKWLERGVPARYAFVPIMFNELRAGFQDSADEDFVRVMEFFKNVPLLVLDDIPNKDEMSRWERQVLVIIIEHRGFNHLPLVVTTNATYNELPESISSRLQRYHDSKTVVMGGQEYRMAKMEGGRIG